MLFRKHVRNEFSVLETVWFLCKDKVVQQKKFPTIGKLSALVRFFSSYG